MSKSRIVARHSPSDGYLIAENSAQTQTQYSVGKRGSNRTSKEQNPGMKRADPQEEFEKMGPAHFPDLALVAEVVHGALPDFRIQRAFRSLSAEGLSTFPGSAEDIRRVASDLAMHTQCGQTGRYREDRWI